MRNASKTLAVREAIKNVIFSLETGRLIEQEAFYRLVVLSLKGKGIKGTKSIVDNTESFKGSLLAAEGRFLKRINKHHERT